MVADDFASDLFVPYGDPLFCHMPFFLEAAILSRTRSPILALKLGERQQDVQRQPPILVVVLKDGLHADVSLFGCNITITLVLFRDTGALPFRPIIIGYT